MILTRTTKPNTDPIPEMSAADLARYRQNRQKSNQLDRDWLLIPITDDDLKPSRHTHYVSSACKCRREISFTLPKVLARKGKRRAQ